MENLKLNHCPIIIIGAPRSGTNMLRDVISSFEDVSTWPFDEINFIWRHGHNKNSSDEFKIENLDEKKIMFMRKEFNKLASWYNTKFVVEKTCANSLRVPYLLSVFPEAKFIFIYRNNIDSIESSARNWKKGHNIKNFFKKLSWYKYSDLLYDVSSIIIKVFQRYITKKHKFIQWGPKLENYEENLVENDHYLIAAQQWYRCNSKAKSSVQLIDEKRKYILEYEKFVLNPNKYLLEILNFLEVKYNEVKIREVLKKISKENIGKGNILLEKHVKKNINQIIANLEKKNN